VHGKVGTMKNLISGHKIDP